EHSLQNDVELRKRAHGDLLQRNHGTRIG
ncbi:MAG: hypothetical protein QOE82_3066, partial [Thermoanaerobaculia bacterium]|nr:hypothetical protein [Thermoanaerobaculia bacterium]